MAQLPQLPPLPLQGIRVLDVSQVMAGPFACMMLADLGADVIKVEPPEGDQTRSSMGFKMKGPDSMGFLNLNRNKRSVTLDLKSDKGREMFYKLAKTADVIVENYRPGVVQRLRIDYESIKAINPKIVYASISGFGQSGPWASRPGFDLMAQAMSGVMSVTGYKGGKPVKAGVPVADIGCALFAVYGVLSAYIGAQRSGEGQHIDASLFDSIMAFSIWDMSDYWGTGVPPTPLGTSNKMSAPYQAVKARDGYFVMGATNQKLWTRLCEVLDRRDLIDHADYASVALRLKNREAMIEVLEQEFGKRDSAEWVEVLLAAGIPSGPILSYPEAFGSEHARHRNMCMEIEHPNEGTVKNIGFPVKLLGTPPTVRRHPPLLGEHNDEIFAEINGGAS
ncbi:CaiB/BaiF CoA transferase family protein [Paraburkholderia phenoliruptrix]|uniref:L-carnitine dehydratase/bile acid-inducible protein F n=2 Tax=Paraburkholderia phenoliruptrix TaxID=252970 RepID=K0DYX9_9BURK|nr:CoA transferase [Paraburkholderia phenoliruptrix]AFT88644.1 L-carnitine dehydratase/bile acid-inducible protein F [Paraburkholderia phenoliruptrix BR3459a]MDR6418912.1 crotonobetainyl-CoA:carnitine CoA-transferase CaiB-like acyl-CoA transferase [Paraburkholderia phenoliruptrix]CAB4047580.1 Acetyl-CoA:oxalate CoA-transferase [Paraburkholderia phenoliruptrix]